MKTQVSVRELKEKMERGQPLLVLDVREGFNESDQMIPGAIHVDAKHLAPDLFKLPHDAEIIVYDCSPQNAMALKVAEALVKAGFCAEALIGGWDQWKKAGYPTEARHEISLREHQKATAPSQESPVERGREALKETVEAAHEARTGVLDVAQRAVNLVVSLFRK